MPKINKLSHSIVILLLCVVYFYMLSFSYAGIYERWSYFGGYIQPDYNALLDKLGVGCSVFLLTVVIFIKGKINQISYVIVCLFVLIPALSIGSVTLEYNIYISVIFATIVFSLTYILIIRLLSSLKKTEFIFKMDRSIPYFFILFIFVVIIVFSSYKIKISIFDGAGIYDLRQSMRQENNSVIAAYAYGMISRLYIAVFTAYVYIKKSKPLMLSLPIFVILVFLIGGHKSIFGIYLLVALLVIFGERTIKLRIASIIFIVIFSICSLYFLSMFIDNYYLFDLTIRRTIHLPALLTGMYFDNFSSEMNFFNSNSLKAWEISFFIGDKYFGRAEMRANASSFAFFYSQLWLVGVAIFAIIFGAVTNFTNSIMESSESSKDCVFIFSVFFAYLWMIMESSLTVVLLTHGLMVFLTFIYISRFKYIE